MTIEAGRLFPSDVLDGPEAPERKIQVEIRSDYWAVVRKRVGKVTPREFANIATRVLRICNSVYGQSEVEPSSHMVGVKSTDIGRMASASEALLWPSHTPDPLGPVVQSPDFLLYDEAFERLFDYGTGVDIKIKPMNFPSSDSSFASINLMKQAPNIVWLYAQPTDNYNGRGGFDLTLPERLYKRMFYVPNMPPSLNFSVGLGIEAHLMQQDKSFGA
jgi:hypothetical protein